MPSEVEPVARLTVPSGVSLPGATTATVTVNRTLCPSALGLTLVATDVVVASWFTSWESVPVPPAKFVSPL